MHGHEYVVYTVTVTVAGDVHCVYALLQAMLSSELNVTVLVLVHSVAGVEFGTSTRGAGAGECDGLMGLYGLGLGTTQTFFMSVRAPESCLDKPSKD